MNFFRGKKIFAFGFSLAVFLVNLLILVFLLSFNNVFAQSGVSVDVGASKGANVKIACEVATDADIAKAENTAGKKRKEADEKQTKADNLKNKIATQGFKKAGYASQGGAESAWVKSQNEADDAGFEARSAEFKADALGKQKGKSKEERASEAEQAAREECISTWQSQTRASCRGNKGYQKQAEDQRKKTTCPAGKVALCRIEAGGGRSDNPNTNEDESVPKLSGDCKKGFQCSGTDSCAVFCECVDDLLPDLKEESQKSVQKSSSNRFAPVQKFPIKQHSVTSVVKALARITTPSGRVFVLSTLPPGEYFSFSGSFVVDVVQETVTVETLPMTGLRVVDRTPPVVPVTTAPSPSDERVGGQTIESGSKSTDSRGGSIQSGGGGIQGLFNPFGGLRF